MPSRHPPRHVRSPAAEPSSAPPGRLLARHPQTDIRALHMSPCAPFPRPPRPPSRRSRAAPVGIRPEARPRQHMRQSTSSPATSPSLIAAPHRAIHGALAGPSSDAMLPYTSGRRSRNSPHPARCSASHVSARHRSTHRAVCCEARRRAAGVWGRVPPLSRDG